jgi:hypothetical protein
MRYGIIFLKSFICALLVLLAILAFFFVIVVWPLSLLVILSAGIFCSLWSCIYVGMNEGEDKDD